MLIIDAKRPPEWVKAVTDPKQVAETLRAYADTACPVSWDVFDAILNPGEVMLP